MSKFDRFWMSHGGLVLGILIVLALGIVCGCSAENPLLNPPAMTPRAMADAASITAVVSTTTGLRVSGVTLTAYVGSVPKVKITDENGKATWYLNYTAEYKVEITVPAGYTVDSLSKPCPANGGIVFWLSPIGEATPTPTIRNTRTVAPTPTSKPTLQVTPTFTPTPWAELPSWVAEVVSGQAQKESGVDWSDANMSMIYTFASESAYVPLGIVHIDTFNGVEVAWLSTTGGVLVAANGQVYEVEYWLAQPTPTPTNTRKPTKTATAVPTIPPTQTLIPTVPPATATPVATPTKTPQPAAYATIVPALYKMFDYGTDYSRIMPELGPVGSVQWAPWSLINPGPGVFNWGYIDQRIATERGLTVTLATGEVVPKPILLQVIAYTSDAGNPAYIDWTPKWVCDPHVMGSGNLSAVVPRYDNPAWREAYWAMVRAFGARYNNDPQITAIVVTTGLDGETTPTKDGDANWETVELDKQLPGLRYRFTQFVEQTMAVYREAFPSKTILINNAPGGMRMSTSEMAASYDPTIGLKHSGMWYDLDSHQGYGDFIGSWDHIAAYSQTLPIWLESPFGLGDDEARLWSLYAGLHYHPAAISLHPEYLKIDPAYLRWASAHCGVTITDTPSVWTVLRDFEYPLQSWGSGGTSGKMGDWQFWLYRDGEAQRDWAIDATEYGRQARWIGEQPNTFRAAPGFEIGRVVVTLKAQGQTFTLEDPRYIWELTAPNDGSWIDFDIDVANCSEFVLTNAGYVHKVECFRETKQATAVDTLYVISMAADSNLTQYGQRMIDNFDKIPDNVAVEVLFDAFNLPTQELTLTEYNIDVIERANANTGDGATLAEWLARVMARWDAGRVILVLADHGDGTRGISFDYPSGHDYLTPVEMELVLETAVQAHGDRIDLVWYDACLMQSIEMAELTSHYARYQGGYENLGWSLFDWDVYVTFTGTTEQIATQIGAWYMTHLTGPRNVSVLNLAKIGPVLDLVSQLSQKSLTEAVKVAQRLDNGEPFGSVPAGDTMYDLKHLSQQVGLDTKAVDDFVLFNQTASATQPGGQWVNLARCYGVSIHHRPLDDRIWTDYSDAFDRFCDVTGWCERPASVDVERFLTGWPPGIPPMLEK